MLNLDRDLDLNIMNLDLSMLNLDLTIVRKTLNCSDLFLTAVYLAEIIIFIK